MTDQPLARPQAEAPAPVTLTGRLVRLEPLAQGHFEGLYAAARHERETFPLTTVPQTREGMRRWLDQALAAAAKGLAVPFATIDLADGALVGSTRFGNLERWEWPQGALRPEGGVDAVEIGWTWLAPRAQRSGINTEAKLLMLRHAFGRWLVHRVTLKTDARNQRSRSAIERIGGRLDGVLRAHLAASDGGLRDSAVYSILASEWPLVEERLRARLR